MAGWQHETRSVHDSSHKLQVSDESTNKNQKKNEAQEHINDFLRHPLTKDQDAVNNEETAKTGIHFYTLSVMNESNKVKVYFLLLIFIVVISIPLDMFQKF